MVYQGTVRGGKVALQPGACLPDGLNVTVEPVEMASTECVIFPNRSAMRNGVPVFSRQGDREPSDLDLVNKLRDESL